MAERIAQQHAVDGNVSHTWILVTDTHIASYPAAATATRSTSSFLAGNELEM